MNAILLAGAALVGLPILLHLIMRQEPKRLPFPAFRFLKERRKTNQRKLRLRHFLLLALRMLLIGLFALALFQPKIGERYKAPVVGEFTLLGDGLLGGNIALKGEQPVAVVLVLDTSPSMGYTAGDKTRLDDARRRALELLDGLPDGSKVAVLETGEPGGDWLPSVSDARRRLDEIKEPRGTGEPATTALAAAYQLLRAADPEADGGEKMQRLVVVLTDRAAGCWDAARVPDLAKLRDAVPDPKPVHAVVDVGVDQPANVAVVAAEVTPQVVPASQPAVVGVTVAAVGADAAATVRVKVGAAPPERKPVTVPAGQSRAVAFEFRDLPPGFHQAEVSLETPDRLAFDNTRYVTFRVGEARKILTVSDDPAAATFWKLAHEAKGEFACDVVTPEGFAALSPAELGGYEVVTLLSVARPNAPTAGEVWGKKLLDYVSRDGGKLIVIPGGEELRLDEYDPTKPSKDNAANLLMPGRLTEVFDTTTAYPEPPAPKEGEPRPADRRSGVAWVTDDKAVQGSPLLAPYREWKQRGNVDVVRAPRKATKFWAAEPLPEAGVAVRYDTADDPAARKPAVLERAVGPRGGKVLLLTTRMDVPADPTKEWHDYWQTAGSSWYVVFPNLLAKYLAGDAAQANFNYRVGQAVPVPLPKGDAPKGEKLVLEGPGVAGADALLARADGQRELRVGPPRTLTPGNFTVSTADGKWEEAFSLNVPAEESNLEKVSADAIEPLTGPGSVVPVGRDVKLRDVLEAKFTSPIDLFPWLLIAVLLLLAAEGLVANRFYKLRK